MKELMKEIAYDFKILGKNSKGKLFIFFFRISHFFSKGKINRIIGLPFRATYKIVFNYILGIDIPDTTLIGKGFNLFHGQGTVVNEKTIIGDNVFIRQNTTIGNARSHDDCPSIGNNVNIGANVVIIGKIIVGNNVTIAAGSVVIKDIPNGVLVAGNPATIKKYINL
ncbi:serine acetyltransferase [Siphonobacter sp. SORGH_AS_1065]|uniref:serine acetyltransferase n=1 Tax=Siphonobacter sp. SORGH_AS_1065 TaxID=3041795 RepID=UPI00278B3BA2|nr:serine acetyltransferase [Siphonobacter sp. SORGH_AS_1065]MDQ1086633.1 putative colanic acid biosynthesis acetyltransferase WcaB [Siphonobacter sp. SORGH_AS_1065]